MVETIAAPAIRPRAVAGRACMAGVAAVTPIGSSHQRRGVAPALRDRARSIACSAADSCPDRSSSSAAIRASASRRCSSSSRHASPADGGRALYVTGEESAAQVRGRAERIGGVVDGLELAATTDLETALAAIEERRAGARRGRQRPDPHQPGAERPGRQRRAGARGGGAPGGGGEGRATCVALVGHVTKEGTVAGPRTLEHLVDAVIYLEGERLGSTRLLRAAKNRFGSTDEVGVLEMRGDGLAEVDDASRFFLESDETPTAGSAVTIALEGTRPLAVEIQALSRAGRLRLAAPRDDRDRRQPRAHAHRRAGSPRRPQPHRPRRLRQRGGWPAHRRAGGRPGGRDRAGIEPARAAGPARRPCWPGEVALSGRLRAAARAERRLLRGVAPRLRAPRHRPSRAGSGRRSRRPGSWSRATSARRSGWPSRPDAAHVARGRTGGSPC